MRVKANKCFHDANEGVLRRPTDTFEVTDERAQFLSDRGLIEPIKTQEPKEKGFFSKEK